MTNIEIIPNLHPIFVHFTVALLILSTALFVIAKILKGRFENKALLNAAYVNLWIGSLITIVTVAMGIYAYYTVQHDSPSHAAMTDHRNWAFITSAVFILPLILSIINYRKKEHYNFSFIAILIVASGLLLTTAYKGGEVVYRYGIGVMSLPQTQGDGGHGSHSHGGAEGSDNHSEVSDENWDDDSQIKVKSEKKTHDSNNHKH